jgi:hypothetical protein
LWRVSPMRELLKSGASKQARNRRRTSVYSSLLCNACNRRKSKHASPASVVAMQHRSCGSWSPRNNSSRVTFSVRSALTNSTTEFSVLSAPRLYNATPGIFAASMSTSSQWVIGVSWEDCFYEEKIYVEYLKSVRLTVCASRSVAGRRVVEEENPSACATVNFNWCKWETALYCLCLSVITTDCVTIW